MESMISTETVQALIPQKAPFVMVDALYTFGENALTAGLTVTEGNIFTNEGKFTEPGIVEHMAQSVALYTGYQYYLKQEQAPTGYIGSIKEVSITRLPENGEKLVTSVSVLQEFMGITLVDIVTSINNEPIAKSQMKTVLAK